jgi:hypothetical protein
MGSATAVLVERHDADLLVHIALENEGFRGAGERPRIGLPRMLALVSITSTAPKSSCPTPAPASPSAAIPLGRSRAPARRSRESFRRSAR